MNIHESHDCAIPLSSLENVTSLFIGTIGGATTFASAKVKNAIGRIGIFQLCNRNYKDAPWLIIMYYLNA